ncbi:MAG: TrbC/VirB2 family protein [Minisyncoccia bacterium]
MNFFKKISTKILALSFFVMPFIVQAVASTPSGTALENPLKADNLDQLVAQGMNIVIYLGAIVAVLAIIWVGFMYVRAMGKPEKIKEAHKAFLYTVIGIAILVGAQVITTIVTNTINEIRN